MLVEDCYLQTSAYLQSSTFKSELLRSSFGKKQKKILLIMEFFCKKKNVKRESHLYLRKKVKGKTSKGFCNKRNALVLSNIYCPFSFCPQYKNVGREETSSCNKLRISSPTCKVRIIHWKDSSKYFLNLPGCNNTCLSRSCNWLVRPGWQPPMADVSSAWRVFHHHPEQHLGDVSLSLWVVLGLRFLVLCLGRKNEIVSSL